MAKRENVSDIFVIGGGINGCAIARDAAGRGYSVFLAEMGDLASGASSTTSKLLDGSSRRLSQLRSRAVRDGLAEREALWAMAPHIVWPLRVVRPHHKGLRPAWAMRMALFAHDRAGGRKLLAPTRTLDLRQDRLGRALKDGYARAFEYSDCWVDDARMVVLAARDAADKGAIIQTRTRAISAAWENGSWTIRLQDVNTNLRGTVRARLLVNAAGPWTQSVGEAVIGRPVQRDDTLTKGSHIVVRRLFDHDHAYLFEGADGRIVHAVPYERDFTLIGTTDSALGGEPQALHISDEETEYLLSSATAYFERPVTRADIAWTFSGVREDDRSGGKPVERDYTITSDGDAAAGVVVTVSGGRLATHRRLAEDAVNQMEAALGKRGKPWTRTSKLPGGEFGPREFDLQVERLNGLYPNLTDKMLRRLARQYGTHAVKLLGNASRMQDLGELFGADLTQREVEYLIEREWARTADDVLWRRTKLGLRLTMSDRAHLENYFRTRKPGGKR